MFYHETIKIGKERGQEWCKQLKYSLYFETSAKDADNI